MDELFRQVVVGANAGVYFLALAGALMIPDICGALAAPDGRATGERYVDWFDTNAADRFHGIMDGDTCYRFRCSLLHQGKSQHPQSRYSRVLFVEPGATSNVFHLNVLNDALNLDVRTFCLDLVGAASEWQAIVAGTEPYDTNLVNTIQRYPDGLSPYIGGVPVIS